MSLRMKAKSLRSISTDYAKPVPYFIPSKRSYLSEESPIVWVVERFHKGKWQPTARMGTTRAQGREEMALLMRLLDRTYRLRKYERVEK